MSFFIVTPAGVITVDTSEIKTDIENAYKEALGEELNLDASTPQGQLIINDTETLTSTMVEVVKLANSFSVYTAEGKALDVAGSFFGYYRKQGIKTVVLCKLIGLTGTVINAGSIVSDGVNNYVLLDNITIGEDGTITGEFQCETAGKIFCIAGSINTIVTPIIGWDTVTNEIDGITGNDRENDNEFRKRITQNRLSIRAKSILSSIVDKIGQLPDVLSVVARENQSDTTQVIDGATLLPHSIYLCILGGYSKDIAKLLTENKTLGAQTNGDVIVEWYDEDIKYFYRYKIARPSFVSIKIQLTYKNNQYTPLNVEDRLKDEIMNYIADNPFKIGEGVSANTLDKSIQNVDYINIVSFLVGTDGINYGNFIDINIDQIATISKNDIEIINNDNN
jgi:uncharacterized phage protein gp47/JayE